MRIGEEKGSLVGFRNNLVLSVNKYGTGRRLRECNILDITNKKNDGSPPSTEILEYSFLNVLPFPNSILSLHYERKFIEMTWEHTPGSAMNQINWGPNTDREQEHNHCVGLLVVHNARRLMEEKKIAFNRTSLESALSRLRENRKTEPFFTVEPYKQLRQKRSTKTAD